MTATNSTETLKKSFSFKKKDPNAVTKIYFDNSSYNWSTPINAYVYDESSEPVKENAKWPGEAMTLDSSLGLYVYEVPDDLTNGNVIFTGGSSRYPGEMEKGLPIGEDNKIFLAGNKWETYSGQQGQPVTQPDPSKTTTVYFDNSSSNFSNPTVYYWTQGQTQGGVSWPGVAMEKYKGNVYKYSFSNVYNCCIFSNGNEQTKSADLSIPGNNYIYKDGSWSQYADAEVVTTPATSPTDSTNPGAGETMQVLLGDVNQDGVVTIKDATLIQHHIASIKELVGAALAAGDVNQDKAVNIKDATAIQYYIAKIRNAKSHCGETIEYTGSTGEQPATQPTTQYVQPTTQAPSKHYVYFKNTPSWSTVKVYFWSDDNKQMMGWPGTDTKNLGDGIFCAEVPDGATWVIFNNGNSGSGNQTSDTKLEGYDKVLVDGQWQGYGN